MILKYKTTNFNLIAKKTNKNIGLTKNDYWYEITLEVKNNELEYKETKEMLTRSEIIDLREKLTEFTQNEKMKKQRIAFIKNYILIYLDTIKGKEKILNLKLIHINNKKDNYIITFNKKEIIKLIELLETKEKD